MNRLFSQRTDIRPLLEVLHRQGPDPNAWGRELASASRQTFSGAFAAGVQFASGDVSGKLHAFQLLDGISVSDDHASSMFQAFPTLLAEVYSKPINTLSDVSLRLGLPATTVPRAFGDLEDCCALPVVVNDSRIVVLFFCTDFRCQLSIAEKRVLQRIALNLDLALRAGTLPGLAGSELEANSEPADFAERWLSLHTGRYSVLGKGRGNARHYVWVENPPVVRARRALNAQERSAVELAAERCSGKQIAFELGLSQSSASRLIAGAATKLGLDDVTETLQMVSRLRPSSCGQVTNKTAALTQAEQAILKLVQAGLSYREMAKLRGRSERTIANQVSSLLQKTGANGRRALACLRS